ncbi:hypothetical protein [Yersinia phage vB_Yru_GN1]|uniref:Uncharacterized protein n=1 Tax=Yersinia phage vB_Yru_GN1 TaxID=3074381 RepID=A0AA86JCR6_9CAUD|nr:hypothetical protein [Yersinia phage vB_Yru_GN1]
MGSQQTYHKCPGCNHMITDLAFSNSRLDYDCPQCGEYKISQFSIVKRKTEEASDDLSKLSLK